MPNQRWVRVRGSGQAWVGPCVISSIIFWPDSDADYADIYDGRDTTDGKKFCRIESSTSITWCFCFGEGVEFDEGVYIDDIDGGTETTIVLTPLER